MMNCENCGHALVGGVIICRECKHNNALRRLGGGRERNDAAEASEITTQRPTPVTSTTRPEIKRTAYNSRPVPTTGHPLRAAAAAPALVAENDQDLGQYPPWRAQLKEKVRQARERRQTGELPAPEPVLDEAALDPNPVVESALKRLRRPDQPPAPATLPRIVRRDTQALAAEEDFAPTEPPPAPELKTAPRTTEPTNPLLPRRTDPFSTQPAARTTPSPASQPANRAEAKETATPPRPATPTLAPTIAKPERKPEAKTSPGVVSKPEPKPEPKPEAKTEPRPPIKMPARITAPTSDKRPTAPTPTPAPVVNQPTAPNTPLATAPNKPVATQIIELTPAAQPATEPELPPFFLAPAREAQAASLWVRTLAGACDFEIVGTAYLPLFASYATLNTSLGYESSAIMLLLLATTTFCYQLLTLMLAGRSFGMAMLNLHLVNLPDDLEPPTRWQRLWRALGATISFLCPPLNLLITYLHRERRSLPDLVSRTTIVES